MLFRIAWRNVWRNKARSAIIIAALALGIWGGVFSDAFMIGMTEQQIYSTIHTETGHLQINKPDFLINHDLNLHLDYTPEMLAKITRIPGVKAAAGRMQMTAMAATASNSAGIMLNGVDVEAQNTVSELYSALTEGTFLPEGKSNRIVIGRALAEKLKAKINSRLVLTLQTADESISYASFKVSGIYKTHNAEFDKQMAFVRRDELLANVHLPENSTSVITILADKLDDVPALQGSLQKALPDLQVQSWQQLSPLTEVASSTIRTFSLVFVGIILFAMAFAIINVMLMAVLDRTREIGMLMSIGLKQSKIFTMIVLETVMLSLTGATLGVLLSMLTVAYFGKTGINLAFLAEGINAIGYSSVVYPSIGLDFYFQLALMVLIIALLAGVYPARKALRLQPAEAVRGD